MRAVTSVAVLLGLACGSVGAENPRVHLKLPGVTASEAAAALSKAAGVPVRLLGARNPAAPDPDPKADFDWSDVSFATALRQMAARYGLKLMRGSGAYVFARDGQPEAAPPRSPLMAERENARIYLQSVFVNQGQRTDFTGGVGIGNPGGLQLQLAVEVPDADAETIAGFDDVVAKDDRGTILATASTRPLLSHPFRPSRGGYPDEWSGSASLPLPHLQARKLEWLEGDLLAFKGNKTQRFEMAPPQDGIVKQTFHGAEVEISRYSVTPSPRPLAPNATEVSFEALITIPAGSPLQLLGGSGELELIGQSGAVFTGSGGGMFSGGRGERQEYILHRRYGLVTEPIAKLALVFTERGEPYKLLSFRLANIPLPQPGMSLPLEFPRPDARPEEPPFRQEGGGTLVSPVRMEGETFLGARLALGLSVMDADGWSSPRWITAPLDQGGVVRIPNLRPGRYRLLRMLRSSVPVPLPGSGHWENAELIVDVTAGQETAVPPLTWAK